MFLLIYIVYFNCNTLGTNKVVVVVWFRSIKNTLKAPAMVLLELNTLRSTKPAKKSTARTPVLFMLESPWERPTGNKVVSYDYCLLQDVAARIKFSAK